MLEHENEIILQTLIDRTIGPRTSSTLEAVLRSDVPRPVKVYLLAEVEQWLERDLRASTRFGRLDDQAMPYVEHVMRTYLSSVAGAYRFARDEFCDTLEHALHFVENYLFRPQWTLENFLFDQKETLLLYEFQAKLRYFSEYRYFVTLLNRTAREREWTEVRATEVRPLIRKIDEQVLSQHSPRELAYLAKPIFSFLVLDGDPFTTPVSLRPLLVFFEDKRLLALRDYLKEACLARAQAEISLNELGERIEGFFLATRTRAASVLRSVTTGPTHRPDVAAPTPHIPPTTASTGEPTSGESPTREISPLPGPTGKTETHFDIPSSVPQVPASLPDVQTLITNEQQRKFVEKLFGDDEAYYSVVITALNGMPSWKEASLYLNDFFDLGKLDPYADEVLEFTDIVYQRYLFKP